MENHNNAEMRKEDRQQLVDLGSDITSNSKGSIYTLTIIGQV
ncbi:MAG TPA: peptidase S14, partial [Candidatus Faecousia excrementigallinarum]|nr:peptidase S14 [Candidatus Faecousia excrementigallinarum]